MADRRKAWRPSLSRVRNPRSERIYQTNTIFAVAAQANVETMLPLLRSLRDDTR
jgi:hypothetical protein